MQKTVFYLLFLFSLSTPFSLAAQNPKLTKNYIIFNYNNPEARSVQLLSSIDGYQKFFVFRKIGETWSLNLDISTPEFQLKPGKYYYKLIVNNIHIADPENDNYETSPYYGRINFFTVQNRLISFHHNPQKIAPLTYRFYYRSSSGWNKINEIMFVGTFNHWQPYEYFLKKDSEDIWYIDYKFDEPGTYYYRYVIDGKWMRDTANPKIGHNQLGETYSIIHATN